MKNRWLFGVFVVLTFLIHYNTIAQQDVNVRLNTIAERYSDQYNEKVYLQTDKELYMVGDTIQLRAFLFSNPLKNETSKVSRFIYVDLVDKNGVVKNREKIKYDSLSHSFIGYVRMYSNIESGEYELQAYTYWMQNKGVNSFFRKTLFISDSSDSEFVTNGKRKGDAEPDMQFFPEGGALISGSSQKIGFIYSGNERGNIGYVKDSGGKRVADIVCDESGFGIFIIHSEQGEKYCAVIAINESVKKEFPLPVVNEALTYSLAMEEREENSIAYTINHTPDVTLHDKYIFAYNSNAFLGTFRAKDSGVIRLDSSLIDGIVYFSLMDVDGNVYSSRAWYYKNCDGKSEAVNISLVNASNDSRTVTLDLCEPFESADVAISVIPCEELAESSLMNGISSYIRFSSEFDHEFLMPDFCLADVGRLNDLLILKEGKFETLSAMEEWLKCCENGPFVREEDMILEGYIVNRKGKPVTNNIVERSGKLIRNGVVSLEGDDDMIYFIYPDNNGYFKRGEVFWDNEIRFFSEYECFMGNRTIYLDLVEPQFLNKFDYDYLAKQNTKTKVDKQSTEWTDKQSRTVVRKSLQGVDMYMPLSTPGISGGPVYTSYKNPELPYSVTVPKSANKAVRSYIKVETKPSMRRLVSLAPQRRRNIENNSESALWRARVLVTSQKPFTFVLPDNEADSKGYAVIINGVDNNGNPIEKIVLTN